MFVSRRNEKIFVMESCCSEETLVCLFVKKERESGGCMCVSVKLRVVEKVRVSEKREY